MATPGDSSGRRRLLAVAGLLALLFCLWQAKLARYQYVPTGGKAMYRVDRWTGEMVYVEADVATQVAPSPGTSL